MDGGDRIRLFCALLLPPEALDGFEAWFEAARRGVDLPPGGGIRVVPRQNLHVTLAFLGSRPAGDVSAVAGELRAAASSCGPPVFAVDRYHETRGAGMVVLRDVTGAATALAAALGEGLERLGVLRREARPWLPHVTVARFRERPGLTPAPPAGANVCPSDAAVMVSVLHPAGAQYEVLEQVRLTGTSQQSLERRS